MMTKAKKRTVESLLHAFLDTHAAVVLLTWIHNRDGIGGLVVCTIDSIEIRCRLRLLFNFSLGLDRRDLRCVAVLEKPIRRIS